MPNPGKRKAQVNKLPQVRAARLRACGSGAAAAAAASEGGMAEMEIDDALSLADEAQRQLEADAAEMNAEMMDAEGEGAIAGGGAMLLGSFLLGCVARSFALLARLPCPYCVHRLMLTGEPSVEALSRDGGGGWRSRGVTPGQCGGPGEGIGWIQARRPLQALLHLANLRVAVTVS